MKWTVINNGNDTWRALGPCHTHEQDAHADAEHGSMHGALSRGALVGHYGDHRADERAIERAAIAEARVAHLESLLRQLVATHDDKQFSTTAIQQLWRNAMAEVTR